MIELLIIFIIISGITFMVLKVFKPKIDNQISIIKKIYDEEEKKAFKSTFLTGENKLKKEYAAEKNELEIQYGQKLDIDP